MFVEIYFPTAKNHVKCCFLVHLIEGIKDWTKKKALYGVPIQFWKSTRLQQISKFKISGK